MKRIILNIVVVLCTAVCFSQNFTYDGINYQVISTRTNSVKVIGQNNGIGQVVIPATVTHLETTYSVIEIGVEAFKGDQLTSVVIPDSVLIIGDSAFANNQLTKVAIGNSVTTIGNGAFLGSIRVFDGNQLPDIILPDSLIHIGELAFSNNQLTQVDIPNNVTTIMKDAFRNNRLTRVTLGDNLTTIGNNAFAFNQISFLVFGNTINTIGKSVFYENKLTHVTIPGSVTTIGDSAFAQNELIEIIARGTTPPTITTTAESKDTFDDRSRIDLVVSPGIIQSYEQAGWTGFKTTQEISLPQITLLGQLVVTIELGDTFTDPGATALDNANVDITNNIITDNPVDTPTATGIYTITYTVNDANGIAAIPVSRTVIVQDTTPPVITLLGDNPQTVPIEDTYTEPGATVIDLSTTDIDPVIDSSTIDTSVAGTYIVTYNATDAAGNAAIQITRTVIVKDTTPPVITLIGSNPQYVELGNPYIEQGAVTEDLSTTQITIDTTAIDTSQEGEYTVYYNAIDAAGNTAKRVPRTVIVQDTTPPVVSLLGNNPQYIELGNPYIEQGAVTEDLSTTQITIDTTAIDTSQEDEYMVYYNAIDAAGNTAKRVPRTVIVQDTTPPIVSLIGNNPQYIELGNPYIEQGAVTEDLSTTQITIDTTAIDTSQEGEYTVYYNATDVTGNAAIQIIRTIIVEDTSIPVITLIGDNIQYVELGSSYIEQGAIALTSQRKDLTKDIIIDNPIDIDTIGTYIVRYNVTNASGNAAIEVTRTVVVQDTTSPVITLLGDNLQRIDLGTGYIELGANTDDGSTLHIDASDFADLTGSYTIRYDATDAAGNTAIQVTRTVMVIDPCPIANLDPDHFTLQSQAETCSGKNNGAIRINAKTELDYILTINEQQLPFTSELLIADLAPATYPICITVDGFSNCQQCFEVVINPGINIAGTTAIQQQAFGNTKLQVAIQTGTPPYTVYVNGLQKIVSQNKNFSIPVANGDQVEVSSAQECQGKLTTKVQLANGLQLYPNPTQGDVTLTLGTIALKNITVVIYNPLGIAVSKDKLSVASGKVIIPMNTLPKGMYMLQLQGTTKTFKVIRN